MQNTFEQFGIDLSLYPTKLLSDTFPGFKPESFTYLLNELALYHVYYLTSKYPREKVSKRKERPLKVRLETRNKRFKSEHRSVEQQLATLQKQLNNSTISADTYSSKVKDLAEGFTLKFFDIFLEEDLFFEVTSALPLGNDVAECIKGSNCPKYFASYLYGMDVYHTPTSFLTKKYAQDGASTDGADVYVSGQTATSIWLDEKDGLNRIAVGCNNLQEMFNLRLALGDNMDRLNYVCSEQTLFDYSAPQFPELMSKAVDEGIHAYQDVNERPITHKYTYLSILSMPYRVQNGSFFDVYCSVALIGFDEVKSKFDWLAFETNKLNPEPISVNLLLNYAESQCSSYLSWLATRRLSLRKLEDFAQCKDFYELGRPEVFAKEKEIFEKYRKAGCPDYTKLTTLLSIFPNLAEVNPLYILAHAIDENPEYATLLNLPELPEELSKLLEWSNCHFTKHYPVEAIENNLHNLCLRSSVSVGNYGYAKLGLINQLAFFERHKESLKKRGLDFDAVKLFKYNKGSHNLRDYYGQFFNNAFVVNDSFDLASYLQQGSIAFQRLIAEPLEEETLQLRNSFEPYLDEITCLNSPESEIRDMVGLIQPSFLEGITCKAYIKTFNLLAIHGLACHGIAGYSEETQILRLLSHDYMIEEMVKRQACSGLHQGPLLKAMQGLMLKSNILTAMSCSQNGRGMDYNTSTARFSSYCLSSMLKNMKKQETKITAETLVSHLPCPPRYIGDTMEPPENLNLSKLPSETYSVHPEGMNRCTNLLPGVSLCNDIYKIFPLSNLEF